LTGIYEEEGGAKIISRKIQIGSRLMAKEDNQNWLKVAADDLELFLNRRDFLKGSDFSVLDKKDKRLLFVRVVRNLVGAKYMRFGTTLCDFFGDGRFGIDGAALVLLPAITLGLFVPRTEEELLFFSALVNNFSELKAGDLVFFVHFSNNEVISSWIDKHLDLHGKISYHELLGSAGVTLKELFVDELMIVTGSGTVIRFSGNRVAEKSLEKIVGKNYSKLHSGSLCKVRRFGGETEQLVLILGSIFTFGV
jgi:hypothetical protein